MLRNLSVDDRRFLCETLVLLFGADHETKLQMLIEKLSNIERQSNIDKESNLAKLIFTIGIDELKTVPIQFTTLARKCCCRLNVTTDSIHALLCLIHQITQFKTLNFYKAGSTVAARQLFLFLFSDPHWSRMFDWNDLRHVFPSKNLLIRSDCAQRYRDTCDFKSIRNDATIRNSHDVVPSYGHDARMMPTYEPMLFNPIYELSSHHLQTSSEATLLLTCCNSDKILNECFHLNGFIRPSILIVKLFEKLNVNNKNILYKLVEDHIHADGTGVDIINTIQLLEMCTTILKQSRAVSADHLKVLEIVYQKQQLQHAHTVGISKLICESIEYDIHSSISNSIFDLHDIVHDYIKPCGYWKSSVEMEKILCYNIKVLTERYQNVNMNG